ENLIRVRLAFQAAHGFDHGDAADTVVPGFGEIALVGQDGKFGDGYDGIADANAERGDIRGVAGAGVEEIFGGLRGMAGVVGSDMRVPEFADGEDRAFAADDGPALIA